MMMQEAVLSAVIYSGEVNDSSEKNDCADWHWCINMQYYSSGRKRMRSNE